MSRARTLLMVAAIAAGTLSCSSARLPSCVESDSVKAPRNFGRVTDSNGEAAAIYRGGQPANCAELAYLKSVGVKSILKLNDRGLPVDSDEKEQAENLGLRMMSFPFHAATIGRPSTCASVQQALSFLSNPENWPVYVHCTAGKDRTGYTIGMYEKLRLRKPVGAVIKELHRYGHRGWRSLLFPQIDREVASGHPVCE